jgi:hypothetical protein
MKTSHRRGVEATGLCVVVAGTLCLSAWMIRRVRHPSLIAAGPVTLITRFPPSEDHETLDHPGVPPERIEADLRRFAALSANTPESRRQFCVELLRDAGFEARVDASGDVWAWKQGSGTGVVLLGAHHDKVEGPSKGVLDDMIGCVLVARTMQVLGGRPARFSHLAALYADEEKGRTIGQARHPAGCPAYAAVDYILRVDYVGDRRSRPLLRSLTKERDGLAVPGVLLTSHPQSQPPTMHTERDDLPAVDFARRISRTKLCCL